MLDSITVFLKVNALGNFAAAARALNLAPSSVTRQIEKLEQTLGQRLFHRTTRSLNLTDAGKIFLEEASQIEEHWQQARLRLQFSEEPAGNLNISVFESFGRLYVSPIAVAFVQRYPRVNLNLQLDDRIVDLHRDNIDIAIRSGRPGDSGLKARLLSRKQLLLVATPDYLQRHGTPQHPSELQHHNCLSFNRHHTQQHWFFRKGNEQSKVAVSGNFTAVGGDPVLRAALAGLGIAITAEWMKEHEDYRGNLVPVLGDWQVSLTEEDSTGIFALYKNDPFQRPAVSAFLDWLTARIPRE